MSVALPLAESSQPDSDAHVFSTFLRLADEWSLTNAQRSTLLDIQGRTFYRWKTNPDQLHLSHDQRTRISYLVNIYLDLHAIFDDEPRMANEWIHHKNDAFAGKAPLEALLTGTFADFYTMYQEVHRTANA